jgi:CheY-like chemotaxis protein
MCALGEQNVRGPGQVILVVDDDRTARELMVAALEPLGRRVVTCASVAGALQEIAADPPGLVVTDRRLGATDGLDLVRAIKGDTSTRGIPVIVVSGDVSAGAAGQARDAGADDYLPKPVPLATLLREAERWLRPGD